jgi:ABC-type nitrate/sulfonate/bicarbonate transport system substrate-binding protein
MLRTNTRAARGNRPAIAKAVGLFALGTAAVLMIAGCTSGGATAAATPTSTTPAKLQVIRVASPSIAGDAIPFAYANATGLWKKFGLDVQVVNSNTSVEYSELGAGQADLAIGGPQGIQAAQKGAPEVIVGGIGPAYVQFLVQSGIKSTADLKGKTLGASAPGSSFDSGQELFMSQKGMKSPADYTTTYFSGNFTAMITALIQKQIDGAWAGQPFIIKATTDNPGLHSIGQIDKSNLKVLLAQLITANSTWAKSHKSAITQFIKAWNEATKESNAHPNQTATYLAKVEAISVDQAKIWVRDQGPDDGYFQISKANFKLIVQAFAVTDATATSAKFADMVDNSYAKAAGVKSGD